jgi:hypothetical protein
MYQYSNSETLKTVVKLGVDDPEIISVDSEEVLEWIGEGNTILPYPKTPHTWESLRITRDRLLKETDKWAMKLCDWEYPITEEQKAYRQALRDLPQTTQDPKYVIWPPKPE